MTSTSRALLIPIIAITAGIVVGGIVLLATGYSPVSAYRVLFSKGFGCSTSGRSSCQLLFTLRIATPIIFTALSAVVAFRAGMFSLGMEGQYVLGGLASAIVAAQLSMPKIIHIPLALLVGAFVGALYGLIPALLKIKLGVNELIATILLNTMAVLFFTYMINFPLRADPSSKAYSRTIQDSARLPSFDRNSKFGLGFFIAIAAAVLLFFFLRKTVAGFEMQVTGRSSLFAKYAGIKPAGVIIRSMLLSGALAGLGGAVSVIGFFDRAIEGFDDGTGFNGLTAAILGGTTTIGAVLVSILFAGISNGAQSGLQVSLGIPRELGGMLTSLIILFVAAEKPIGRTLARFSSSRDPETVHDST